MNRSALKHLLRVAAATSPLIALLTVTPVIIVSGLTLNKCLLVISVVSLFVFIAWLAQLAIIHFIKQNWTLQWYRIPVSSLVILIPGFIVTNIIKPETFISIHHFGLMRLINIVCANTIIYIIIDQVLTQRHKKMLDLENTKLKLANLEAQYKLLKDQINPHFLFNALGTTKALVRDQPGQAEEYLIRLSEFLRGNIKNVQDLISVEDELIQCQNYLMLQKVRFGDSVEFVNDLSESIKKKSIPYFSLITLSENAIKHNAFSIQNPLKIHLRDENGYIIFTNNFLKKNTSESSTGLGLKNLNERCRLLTGKEIIIEKKDYLFSVKLKTQPR